MFKAELELLEPARLSSRQTKKGFTIYSRLFIPGGTLRGAIITALMERGGVDVKAEAANPSIRCEPLYFVGSDGRPFYGPFTYRHKLTREVREVEVDELMKALREVIEENRLTPLRELPLLDPEYERYMGLQGEGAEAWVSAHVAMSKRYRKAYKGLLYSYVCLTEGSKFTGLVHDSGSLLSEDVMDIRIGGAVSRGFGRATLKLSKESEESKTQLVREWLEESRFELNSRSYLCLIARSPIAYFKNPFEVCPYIPRISGRDWKAEIVSIEGKVVVLGNYVEVGGWSYLTGVHKPQFNAGSPGTLLLYRVTNWRKAREELVEKCLHGFDELSAIGFNYLTPLITGGKPRRWLLLD